MEKEINQTPETRVKELALTSGKKFELDVTELSDMAEKAKTIESIEDPQFKSIKKEMVTQRNYIKTYCLDARRNIKKVAEGVSEVETMLLDIFVEEEERLTEMAKVAKEEKDKAERLETLPIRKSQLAEIGDGVEVTDEELLELTDVGFSEYKMGRQTAKMDADRLELEQTRLTQEKEKERLEWEAGAQEREAKAREEERQRADAELKAEKEKIAREAEEAKQAAEAKLQAEADKRAADEKEIADRKEKEEKEEAERVAKRERATRYKGFRASHGWTEETAGDFYEKVEGETATLFRKVGEFDLTQI